MGSHVLEHAALCYAVLYTIGLLKAEQAQYSCTDIYITGNLVRPMIFYSKTLCNQLTKNKKPLTVP